MRGRSGKTREEVHDKWLALHAAAKRGPVVTKAPILSEYLAYWLAEVIEPNREPNTYSQYELFSRRYIIPDLGKKECPANGGTAVGIGREMPFHLRRRT